MKKNEKERDREREFSPRFNLKSVLYLSLEIITKMSFFIPTIFSISSNRRHLDSLLINHFWLNAELLYPFIRLPLSKKCRIPVSHASFLSGKIKEHVAAVFMNNLDTPK